MILAICLLCNFLGFLSAGSVCGRFQRIFAQAAQLVLAKLFGWFSALAAEFVVCVSAAARLKFHPKISLAAVADTAPRLALRENSQNEVSVKIRLATLEPDFYCRYCEFQNSSIGLPRSLKDCASLRILKFLGNFRLGGLRGLAPFGSRGIAPKKNSERVSAKIRHPKRAEL